VIVQGGRAISVVFATLALAACGSSDDAGGPGDVSVSEAKALDEAAEMIEAHRPPAPATSVSAPLPPPNTRANTPAPR
jgi:hypothetical protein